jgi:hypothetical protein
VLNAEIEALKRKLAEATERTTAAERSMKSHEAELELAKTDARQARAEAERIKASGGGGGEAAPAAEGGGGGGGAGELAEVAQQVYDAINDILSELRNNILLIQGEVGTLAGGGGADSVRIITETVESLVGNAEDAKGALRGLRDLAGS